MSAIYVEEDGNGQLYYAYIDYLGSLTALTDVDGEVVERQGFDPCSVNPLLCKARSRVHWLN